MFKWRGLEGAVKGKELKDFRNMGPFYPWYNGQKDDKAIWEKLYRCGGE